MKRIRTFVAVDLAPRVTTAASGLIELLQRELASNHTDIHWVDTEQMHVTIKFLGDVDESELADVCRGVELACRTIPSFELQCLGLGVFPRPERPRTIWLGIDPDGTESLQRLHLNVEHQMVERGFLRENRRYAPHVTLGRVRGAADWRGLTGVLESHTSFQTGGSPVEALIVYASRLARGGPTYMPLARIPLA